MSADDNKTAGSDADDMDQLLQSALDDFDKPMPTLNKPSTSKEKSNNEIVTETTSKLQEDFEEKFKTLLLNDSNESSFVNNMSSLLTEVQNEMKLQPNASGENDGNAVSQAIDSLMPIMEQMRNSTGEEENGFTFNDDQNENMFPFMEQMFQMLMSKEVLYPSLLAVKEQYPTWLIENKDKTDAAEIDRYSKQYDAIKKICDIFESENDSDPEDAKQKRFSELLRLLEEMSALGQPPADFADSLPSTPGSMPMFNNSPDSCNMM